MSTDMVEAAAAPQLSESVILEPAFAAGECHIDWRTLFECARGDVLYDGPGAWRGEWLRVSVAHTTRDSVVLLIEYGDESKERCTKLKAFRF